MFGFLRARGGTSNFLQIPLPEVKGRLYVSPMPFGPYDTANAVFKEYVRARIDRVVPLVTDAEIERKAKRDPFKAYEKQGMKVTRIPFADLTAPVLAEIQDVMGELLECLQRERIVVHCNAGVGRTGVMASCMIRGLRHCTGEEAVMTAKQFMQTDLTSEQQRFVDRFELAEGEAEAGASAS